MIGGQQLRAARAGNPENAIALQQLIAQQQAALMQRLTGKPVPAVAAPATAAAPVTAPTTSAAPTAMAPSQMPEAQAIAAPPPAAEDGQAQEGAPAASATAAALARASSIVVGRVVRLACMVERDELLDEEDYQDIMEDTKTEVSKYGALKQVSHAGNPLHMWLQVRQVSFGEHDCKWWFDCPI